MKEELIKIIYSAIDEINNQNEYQIEKNIDSPLYSKNSQLDSLALVNIIVFIEDEINERYGISISLADEKAMSQVRSPFRTVGTLLDYIDQTINSEIDNG